MNETLTSPEAGQRARLNGPAFVVFVATAAATLAPVASVKDGPLRILVASKLGKTRLIDNIGV